MVIRQLERTWNTPFELPMSFLEHANDDWYRVIRQLRTLAARYGSNPD